jgi:hypothetical protein
MNYPTERFSLTPTLVFSVGDGFARDRAGGQSPTRVMGPLQFWLAARVAPAPREDFATPWEMVMQINRSGYYLFFGLVQWPDGGRRRITLDPGRYLIRVTSPLYQPLAQAVSVPMGNLNYPDLTSVDPDQRDPMRQYSFSLEPGATYPFPNTVAFRPELVGSGCVEDTAAGRLAPTLLRGSLHSRDGRPIAGARVSVAGWSNTYTTGDSGDWVLWFADTRAIGPVPVHVDFPDGTSLDVPNVCVVRWRETSLRETALRGWVLRSGRGVAGAVITVAGQPGAATSSRDGGWTYYFALNQPDATVDLTATLPDGAGLTIPNVPVRQRATVLAPAFIVP